MRAWVLLRCLKVQELKSVQLNVPDQARGTFLSDLRQHSLDLLSLTARLRRLGRLVRTPARPQSEKCARS